MQCSFLEKLSFSVTGFFCAWYVSLLHRASAQSSPSDKHLQVTSKELHNFSAAKCVHPHTGLSQRDTAANDDS